ncbi:MAG: hypothetical protein FJ220_07695 [Kiritimatiellaceae bacterium]|nr:hypothetical protein [Kiritimatiellaceae bacterium]
MKNRLWIGWVVVGFSLQSLAQPEPQAVAGNPVEVRISLPQPVCPVLSRRQVPVNLEPLFGWKDIGGEDGEDAGVHICPFLAR